MEVVIGRKKVVGVVRHCRNDAWIAVGLPNLGCKRSNARGRTQSNEAFKRRVVRISEDIRDYPAQVDHAQAGNLDSALCRKVTGIVIQDNRNFCRKRVEIADRYIRPVLRILNDER
jgi:hypothetical protein